MKILAFIFAFINEAWGLIFKAALVILAIVVVVGFIRGCAANATLNEHSSCQQFAQADATTQDKVLQDMTVAHGGSKSSVATTRFSVTLYCDFHSEDSPIDGIYNSSETGRQPVSRSVRLFEVSSIRFSNFYDFS